MRSENEINGHGGLRTRVCQADEHTACDYIVVVYCFHHPRNRFYYRLAFSISRFF